MAGFTLHADLERDTFTLGKMPLCRVQLMNNALFPWVILVPERENMKEIIDLNPADREQLLKEICHVSEMMKKVFKADKLNIAALGNMTPQLHVHIIARYTKDAAWPKPVWGQASEPYTPEKEKELAAQLGDGLKKISF